MPRARTPGVRPSSWIRPEKRHAVYLRDEYRCVWCASVVCPDTATLDHLFPRGHPQRSNKPVAVVTACVSCNTSRKDTDPLEYLQVLAASGQDVAGVLRRMARRHLPLNKDVGAAALRLWRLQGAAPIYLLEDPPF